MGYSNVKVGTIKGAILLIKQALKKENSNLWSMLDYIHEVTGKDGKQYVLFGWKDIEWFLSYKDVFTVEKILNELKAKGVPVKFMRIGDNPNDIQEYCANDFECIINNAEILKQMLMGVRR